MSGELCSWENGVLQVPDHPVIGYVPGDGIGPELWRATRPILDEAVAAAYPGAKKIEWRLLLAGEAAHSETGEHLPAATLDDIRRCRVVIKGPLTTPVGSGFRSINVTLRQVLDLYACIRPVRWFPGIPSPLKRPEGVDLVIFRENSEDIYAGIEWPSGSEEASRLMRFLAGEFGIRIRCGSALGIKPISPYASRRLVAKAIEYGLEHNRRSVTMVHKGNIMKYTEGGFAHWGYELAGDQFEGRVVREGIGQAPEGGITIGDRIADNMFQQLITRPADYDVIAAPNLNGDYLSDAAAGLIGGLGMAPGANLSDEVAVFEPVHGSAPKYAGLGRANPSSLILSGAMMLDHLGWREASRKVVAAVEDVIAQGKVTADLARHMEGAQLMGTEEFAAAVVDAI